MTGKLQPLDEKFAIVGPDGKPTLYFTRWAQQRMQDISGSISEEQALVLIQEFVDTYALQAGLGISIAPDGKLTSNPTISANIQVLLDTLSTDHGAVLYRDVAGWAALAPGTVGQVLSTNGPGADPSWVAQSGGGGGGPTTPVIRATRAALAFNSSSVVVTWPAGTVAGDVVFLFTAHGWNAIAPAGWATVDNQAGSFVNGAIFQKTMTAGDITAGSVTVNYGGFFNGTIQAVTIEGGTFTAVRSTNAIRSSSGAVSVAFNSGASDAADLLIGYFGNRAASNNVLPAGWTSLASVNATDGSSVFGSLPGATGGVTGTATASSAGSGYYTAVLSLQGPTSGGGGGNLTPPVSGDFPITLGSPTIAYESASVLVSNLAGGGSGLSGIGKTTSGSVTLTGKIGIANLANFNGGGLFMSDGTRFLVVGQFFQSFVLVSQWNTRTSFNNEPVAIQSSALFPQWFRMIFNGTDVTLQISYSGDNWLTIQSGNTWLSGVTSVGFVINRNNATESPAMWVESFAIA